MIARRQAHSLCVFKNYVYAFGGTDENNKHLTSIERLSLTDSQSGWEKIADMPKPLCSMGLLAYDNYILVFGGVSISETQDEILQFDPTSLTFTNIGKLAKPDSFPHAESIVTLENGLKTCVLGRAFAHDMTPGKTP